MVVGGGGNAGGQASLTRRLMAINFMGKLRVR